MEMGREMGMGMGMGIEMEMKRVLLAPSADPPCALKISKPGIFPHTAGIIVEIELAQNNRTVRHWIRATATRGRVPR